MRQAALAVLAILLIGGLAHGRSFPQEVHAQGETDTPTPSDTPSPQGTAAVTETATATETSTPTATPNLYWVATAPSGQAVAIVYTMTGGEALNATLQMIIIGLITFGLFLALRGRR